MEDNNKQPPQTEKEKENELKYKKEHIKTLKDLLASSKRIERGSGSGGSGGGGDKPSNIPDVVKNQFDKIKEAFTNNPTVKFLSDPIGTIGGGIRQSLSPLKKLVPDFSKIKEGILGAGGALLGGRGGSMTAEQFEGLKSELLAFRNAIEGRPTYTDQFLALETALGRIETVLSGQELSPADTDGLREDLSNLQNLQISGPQFDRFDLRQSPVEPQEGILGNQNTQPNVLDKPDTVELSQGTLNSLSSLNSEGIGKSIGNAIKGDDQLKREQERDRILREEQRNEDLVGALDGIELGGALKVDGKGGFANFFGSLFQAFTGGKVAGGLLVGLGAAIKGFMIAVGSGFAYIGALIKPISLGAIAVGLMGASLLPFVYSLQAFGNLNNMKDSLINFGIGLTALATAAGILGAIMMSQVGAAALVLGAVAIAGLGASLLPMAAALALASPGMESFGNFLERLNDVGFLGLTGAAAGLGLLSSALLGFGAAGILNFFTPGKKGMIRQLEQLSETGPGLKQAADSLKSVAGSLGSVRAVGNLGIGNFFKEINTMAKNFKPEKFENIGESLRVMFEKMAIGLHEVNVEATTAVGNLLRSTVDVAAMASDGAQMESLQAGFNEINRQSAALLSDGGRPTKGDVTQINRGGDSTVNQYHAQSMPFNNLTLHYMLGTGNFPSRTTV